MQLYGTRGNWSWDRGGASAAGRRRDVSLYCLAVHIVLCFCFPLLDVWADACGPPHHRHVSTEEGEQRAQEMNVLFIETSAKTGYGVKQVESQPASEAVRVECLTFPAVTLRVRSCVSSVYSPCLTMDSFRNSAPPGCGPKNWHRCGPHSLARPL